jgi:hypothetical protein
VVLKLVQFGIDWKKDFYEIRFKKSKAAQINAQSLKTENGPGACCSVRGKGALPSVGDPDP